MKTICLVICNTKVAISREIKNKTQCSREMVGNHSSPHSFYWRPRTERLKGRCCPTALLLGNSYTVSLKHKAIQSALQGHRNIFKIIYE